MADPLLSAALAAMDAARQLVRDNPPGQLTAKGDRDMASATDFAVERAVRSLLRARTPEIGFLGEEEGATAAGASRMWVLDPIDGTVNLVHGMPLCAISLGLVHQGRPVLGVIDLPFLGARYSAVEGQGAQVDGRPLRASQAARLRDAVVAIGDYAVGHDAARQNRSRLAITARLAAGALRVRMLGSAAIDLAWVAEGRLDAAISLVNRPWDTAAGVVVAREAGAAVVDQDGSPHTMGSAATIAAAPRLLGEVVDLVQDALAEVEPDVP